jgi:hypothetical protein
MSIDLARPHASLPIVTFGPFRFLEALPWLALAAGMRIIAFSGGAVALPAIVIADIAILFAYMGVSRRSIELSGGHTGLGRLAFRDQLKLCFSILGNIVLLMVVAAICVGLVAGRSAWPNAMSGIDGMAFDQATFAGMFWSATIATLVLLMIIRAEQEGQLKTALVPALRELVLRFRWLAGTIAVIGLMQVVLHFIQGGVRWLVVAYGVALGEDSKLKLYIFFAYIIAFATLRLWMTILILTFGMRQSYIRERQESEAGAA